MTVFSLCYHRYPLRAVKHGDEARRVDYSSITTVLSPAFNSSFKGVFISSLPVDVILCVCLCVFMCECVFEFVCVC
jgi:predicted membrane channel-forming protein YqfA (hemolysin III family)